MEQFPAMTDEVFEYIKKVIDECSYYVVVSGGRYGSKSPLYGKSYTQLEFEYAKAAGIPLLCFLLDEGELRRTADKIPSNLVQFRRLMMTGRNVYLFKNKDELPNNIVAALIDRLAAPPKTFWISSNDIDFQNLTRVKTEGVIRFDAESNTADHTEGLRDSNRVFAMLNDGYGWVRKYKVVLEARFANPGKTTTIVLLDPESPVIPLIAQRSNKSIDEQVRDIWDCVARLVAGAGAEAYNSGRLHVLGCPQPISGCYFIFDSCLIWNPYLTRYRPPQLPRIEFSRIGGRLTELLLTDAEVIERELRASKAGDLVVRVREIQLRG